MSRLHVRGIVQRLATPLEPDAYLSLLHPLWGSRLRGILEAVRPVTDGAASIVIRPGAAWEGHRPGQFVTVGVDVDGVRHHRSFSLTSVPDDDRIEITVQATTGGVVSNHLVHRSRPGEIVQLEQAAGDFSLPDPGDRNATRLLFVTGGSGITPAMGMLRSLVASGASTDVVLVHHATDADRLLFADELARLDARHDWLRVEVVLTRPDGGASRDHLTAARLDHLCPDWRERRAYVSGPEPMLRFAIDHWDTNGLTDRLLLERFTPFGFGRVFTTPCDVQPALTRFARSDLEVRADPDTTLLEVAEGAGLTPASGCRMGICHTCSTRLEQGCVRDLRDGRTRTAGQHIQLCVSAAVNDVVLDL